MGLAGYEKGYVEIGKVDSTPLPTQGWSRTLRDARRAQFHYFLPDQERPVCGRKISSMRNLPRALTERQIETQGCPKCAAELYRVADEAQDRL
jgi:hypothetical protein